jgi:hypothetical protein
VVRDQLVQIGDVGLALELELDLARPENQSSSSASRSNVPAVSTENAWILEKGNEVKSFFLPVMPWTFTAMIRLEVNAM